MEKLTQIQAELLFSVFIAQNADKTFSDFVEYDGETP